MHHRDLSLVKPCIDAGADVRSRDSGGFEPLHYAAQLGKPDVAKFLIDQKASISAKTIAGLEPLHLASMKGHLSMVKLSYECKS